MSVLSSTATVHLLAAVWFCPSRVKVTFLQNDYTTGENPRFLQSRQTLLGARPAVKWKAANPLSPIGGMNVTTGGGDPRPIGIRPTWKIGLRALDFFGRRRTGNAKSTFFSE